jgi:alpha/beta superfamily hydrolase
MKAATLSKLVVAGPAGRIEVAVNDPGAPRRGIALVAHPHPLYGGTNDNKVVTTLARAFFELGWLAARPNFRGVGASQGEHDHGIGETEDLVAVAGELRTRHGDLPLAIAGFSFGGFVATRLVERLPAEHLVLVAPAIGRYALGAVPPSTLLVHGEEDDVVPLEMVLNWARPQQLPVVLVPGAGHYFHGRLGLLGRIVRQALGAAGR